MNKDRILTVSICLSVILFGLYANLRPVISYKTGLNYLKKQDYVKAYTNLKQAYSHDHNNKDYRYYYVEALKNLSPTPAVQKEIFEIANSDEQDSAQQSAESKVNQWRLNISNTYYGNYIEQVPTENKIIRWDEKKFPLKTKIIIDSNLNVPDYYRTEILRALEQWHLSTGFIKFEITEKDADIVIKIAPTPKDICSEGVCHYIVGFTKPDIKGKKLNKMVITLYANDARGNFFSDKELYNTILHETGHALGIMGHSYSSEDLMYMSTNPNTAFYAPYRSSFQYLSAKDINTIRLLYKLIPDITNSDNIDTKGLVYASVVLGTSKQILEKKLKEAQNYIKNAPELYNGYVDLGLAYQQLGKNKDAIKAMQKADSLTKTPQEKYITTYNLAAIYYNNNEYDKALEYANQAKQISNDESVQELIMNINHELKK